MTTSPPIVMHDIAAEAAVIGAALSWNDLLDELTLDAEHFSDPVNAKVWEEMRRLRRAGATVDHLMIRNWGLRQSWAEAISPSSLTVIYANQASLGSAVYDHAELIRSHAARRALTALSRRMAESASTADDVMALAADLRADLDALLTSGRTGVGALLREAWAQVEAGLSRPLAPSAQFGLAALDRRLGGLFAPDLIILAGRPAMGKTSLATNIAVNAALAGGVVHFASLEMSAEQLAGRVGSRLIGGFNYSDLRQPDYRPSPEMVAGKAHMLPEAVVIDDTGTQTIDHLEAQARNTRRRFNKLSLIVVDYLQLMRDPRSRNQGRVQEVSEITMGLKGVCKRLNVPVLALSQLSRQVESRDDKRPQMSDLRESGSIEQDADSVLFGYRDEYYLKMREPKQREGESRGDFDHRFHDWADACDRAKGVMEVIVGKNRHGATGVERLRFNPPRDAIEDEA